MSTLSPADEAKKKADEDKKKADELATNKIKGKWEEPFSIENVACHATLLPNGKVLCWSRRSNPMSPTASMNEQRTNAFLIDMNAKKGPTCTYTSNQPQSFGFPADKGSNISLFCSGHCLQADGTLFVVGGHITDTCGLQQACIYNPGDDTWSAQKPPNNGRWYPSAFPLPDSAVLVISGTDDKSQLVPVPQIWRSTQWDSDSVQSPPMITEKGSNKKLAIMALYPRLHLDPRGQVFMAGPNGQSIFLDLSTRFGNVIGEWGPAKDDLKRELALRENGASVTYDSGKVLWAGGGNDGEVKWDKDEPPAAGPPTNTTEVIDLNVDSPKWQTTMSMNSKRRQHNLTTLPDGTVLVTGGTRGLGFNDLRTGQPVRTAELWNPTTQKWTDMAEESTDRCYHGVALLMPDGSVLSAGGGEGGEFDAAPNPTVPHPWRDNHTNAQVYKPPYFFIGDPPQITGVPTDAKYGQPFDVTVKGSDTIGRASWIRLPSVTHGLNTSQSVFFEVFKEPKGGKITITPPTNRNVATPGHYMLFFVNAQGRPSQATIIKISSESTSQETTPKKKADPFVVMDGTKPKGRMMAQTVSSLPDLNEKVIAEEDRHAVKIGLTPVCPYGLGPCWAGAFEGLQHIDDIDIVRPLPDQANSVAYVYLKEDKLPDIDSWRKELANVAGAAYNLRGIELTVSGTVMKKKVGTEDRLVMSATTSRPDLALAPFEAASKLERDHKARTLKPTSDHELSAYSSLDTLVASHAEGVELKVTGRLHKLGEGDFSLDVRMFEVVNDVANI